MADIFVNQSLLTIRLQTGYDIAAATVKKILYTKPGGGITGFWSANVADTTDLVYDVQTGDLNVAGLWKFQPYVEIGGKKGYGTIVKQYIGKAIT